ncbi:substrate-binding domain-containing protein [Alteromonas sp. 14N.309.X.WAT.G.H12]|uniref:substrate-binding domain-containing protein n=1 Tax=Alteromonas sp. 14N.309.X.WAT.G.H12 TaxID=3120824 RepID=UPI002FD0327B
MATPLRRQGFEAAMKEAALTINTDWLLYSQPRSSEEEMTWLEATLSSLMNKTPKPSAILCGNDKMAFRVMMILRARNIDIPAEVSVLGFDDFTMISESTVPSLTTVSLPYYQMGRRAVELALDMIESGERPNSVEQMKCTLVKRSSDRLVIN